MTAPDTQSSQDEQPAQSKETEEPGLEKTTITLRCCDPGHVHGEFSYFLEMRL